MSGEIDLGRDERIVALVRALAALVNQVPVAEFAVIGGLAVLTALEGAHRVTNDVDTVAEQHGDNPTIVEIALTKPGADFGELKIDCIPVGDTAAAGLVESDLPDDKLDRAFILGHRWAFDTAQAATLRAGGKDEATAVTCRFAPPASIVSMKLQSAPRRRTERAHKAGGDYFDLYRLLSHPSLVRPIAQAFRHAPHDLGEWSLRQIGSKMVDDPGRMAAVIARSGVAVTRAPTADEIYDAGARFLEVWEDAGHEGHT